METVAALTISAKPQAIAFCQYPTINRILQPLPPNGSQAIAYRKSPDFFAFFFI